MNYGMPLDLTGVRWLFFDLGYTLINEDGAAMGRLAQVSDALGQHGIEASPADLRAELEAASARFDPNPFRSLLLPFTDDEDVIAFVRSSGRYPKELESPYPQTLPLLKRLHSKYKLGVIANQPPGTQERLTQYGMAHYFDVCVSSGDVGISKPDAAIFHLALEHAACAPSESVMIGDRLDNDIRPAKALGFRTVRVLQGPGRLQQPRNAAETPDATAANLGGVATLFGSV
ncbi:MAG: HAD family hydrolase [Chloroflexi bacterium]|nr:HAD family hydrolase [Chloroflexota bacterium]